MAWARAAGWSRLRLLSPALLIVLALAPAAGAPLDVPPASQAASAAEPGEARDELRKPSAAPPQDVMAKCRLALRLLDAGLAEPARREAEQAVALGPGYAFAQAALGRVLEHDAVGRRFGRGFDRAGALAAFRQAEQLDPKDWSTRAELAILLEHDARGGRYGAGADLAAAIAEHQAIRAGSKSEALTDDLLADLLSAGRASEAKELLAELPGSEPRSALSLAATALLAGPEAAAREAGERLAEPAARSKALGDAAYRLLLLRRYPEATALFGAVAKAAPKVAGLRAEISLIASARRHEEVALPPGRPETVVRRLLALMLAEEANLTEAQGLLSRPELHGHTAEQELGAARSLLRPWVETRELPPDVILDLVLALRTSLEGDDAVGYRVQLASPDGPPLAVAFVVREEGGYRFAGVGSRPESLGAEALRRVEAKDWKGALPWLDWARAGAPIARGDDPLAAPPIVRLWAAGAAAGEEEARCAAASLMMGGREWIAEAEPVVARCRDASGDPARRAAFDLALAIGYGEGRRYPELLAVVRRLLAAYPRSRHARDLEVGALAALGRWEEVRAIGLARLKKDPADDEAERMLAEAAMRQGRPAEMESRIGRLIARGKATADDLNNLAWWALFRGNVGDADLEHARRAAELDGYKSAASLHTLASLCAERGLREAAYKVILQAIAAAGGEPRSEDWYVFGRLAESYELPADARVYYERVKKTEAPSGDALSAYALARARLAALSTPPSP